MSRWLPGAFSPGSEEEAQLTAARLQAALKHNPAFLA